MNTKRKTIITCGGFTWIQKARRLEKGMKTDLISFTALYNNKNIFAKLLKKLHRVDWDNQLNTINKGLKFSEEF
jgi:hypothetical protein